MGKEFKYTVIRHEGYEFIVSGNFNFYQSAEITCDDWRLFGLHSFIICREIEGRE